MMYSEIDIRLGNLENLMMDEEPMNPEIGEGPTVNHSTFNPLNQTQDEHDFTDHYNTSHDFKRQRYELSDSFDHTNNPQSIQMREL